MEDLMSRASRSKGPVRCTLDIRSPNGRKEDMNDPEVTMSNAATNTNLIAHAKALDANGAETALFLFDEVRAMTWRLLNPKP